MLESPAYGKVFVVGCVRSGTSWVRSTLGSHPDALTTTESHAFHDVYAPVLLGGAPWADLLERFDASVSGQRPVGPHRWVDRETFAAAVERSARLEAEGMPRDEAAALVVRGVLDGFFVAQGGRDGTVVVEKTPTHLFFAEEILWFFPEARVVEVVRDGRDACVSMQMRALTEAWPPKERRDQVRRWVDAVEAGLRARALPASRGRWHVVRFEALKADPLGETRRLLQLCGLADDDDTVARVVEANAFSALADTGDGKHQRKGEVGEWRHHFSAADEALFREIAGPVFERAGYRFED